MVAHGSLIEEFTCRTTMTGKDRHSGVDDLITDVVEDCHGDSYGGYSTTDYLRLHRRGGGTIYEAHGVVWQYQPRGFQMGRKFIIPYPVIRPDVNGRGLACQAIWTALVQAMHEMAAKPVNVQIVVRFPNDAIPSDEAIRKFGLCPAFREAEDNLFYLVAGRGGYEFVVAPSLLPHVVAERLRLSPVGVRHSECTGRDGRATLLFPESNSPLRGGYLGLLQKIARGDLSSIFGA